MSRAISDVDVFAYSKATGMSVEGAREALLALKPELRKRVIRAAQARPHRDGFLHDPLENDPKTQQLVRRAAAKAARVVTSRDLGSCHAVWAEQARILWKEHRIRWYSPAKMNPFVCFD
jgi:hypothetical protein